MNKSLQGRVAVVTGGTRGIGYGIAQVLSNLGAKVSILGRDAEQAHAAALSIGNEVRGFGADVGSLKSLENVFDEVAGENGHIDIVCANAGIFPAAKLEDMTSDQWDEVMRVNLTGTFNTTKAALPYLKESSQPRIIITSSITGPFTGYPGWSHYAATKAGQLGFMRTACLELSKYGVTVNAVMPGNIMTEGLQDLGEDYLSQMAHSIPLKRLGSVHDIGHAVAYFASSEASYVTGQTLIVDGGQILPESLEALNSI